MADLYVEYESYEKCPKCQGENDMTIKDSVEGCPSEVETECQDCGFVGYWAFGFFKKEPQEDF